MRAMALAIAFTTLIGMPALAQQAAIDAANAKWIELFNKGDYAGVSQLYTEDAVALPPGSPMVKGRAAIAAMWKGMAEQAGDPKLTTIEVKRLGPKRLRLRLRQPLSLYNRLQRLMWHHSFLH